MKENSQVKEPKPYASKDFGKTDIMDKTTASETIVSVLNLLHFNLSHLHTAYRGTTN